MKNSLKRHFCPVGSVLLATLAACPLAAGPPHNPAHARERPVSAWLASPLRRARKYDRNFSFDPKGGPSGDGSLIITADEREGLSGWWQKSFPIVGGQHYRFHAQRKVQNVKVPRRSAVVRILWQDDKGKPVPMSEPAVTGYLKGWAGTAEPEHPTDKETDAQGWTEVSDTYQAPPKATQALIELHLQWAPAGKIEWSNIALTKTKPPAGRKVRLASVHFRPSGKSPQANCEEFAPLIDQAATAACRPGRAGRDADLLRHRQIVRGNRRACARALDGILRCTGQETWPVHRCRPARARWASDLQRGRAAGPRRQGDGQVPQSLPPARRNRRRASLRARNTRCFQPASASWE